MSDLKKKNHILKNLNKQIKVKPKGEGKKRNFLLKNMNEFLRIFRIYIGLIEFCEFRGYPSH